MHNKKQRRRSKTERYAERAYDQCVRMRMKINQRLLPLAAKLTIAVKASTRELEIIAKELRQRQLDEE